jgi:membrane-bound lytic murein transglycosylase D
MTSPKRRYTNKTASKMIVEYKEESQRNELARIINGNDSKKPLFLSSKLKTDEYQQWLNYFSTTGKRGLLTHIRNGERYRPLIEQALAKHNLPKELYFVGLIESGYELSARSHASAVGPWQFMSDTAKRYNLKVTRSVDERKNIIKSTNAAARYFQDLYNIFGNWELALSAYNAGEFGVIRRIRSAKSRNFYVLADRKVLPKETRNYIPKLKAAMEVYNNPRRYGIRIPKVAALRRKDLKKYTIKSRANINQIARKIGVRKSVILSMNPDINYADIPKFRKSLHIYVPRSAQGSSYKKSYSKRNIANTRVHSTNQTHKVRSGDSLIAIAKRYRVWVRDIIALNNIKSKKIYVNQSLKIPKSPYAKKIHVVRRGDYLIKIAQKYGVSIKKIKKANSMRNSKIFPGQKLVVSL